MSTYTNIWVASENPQDYSALCALAQKMGSGKSTKVSALWIGCAAGAESVQSSGAHTVYFAETGDKDFFGSTSAAAINAIKNDAPDVILFSTSKNTRLLAARLAAKLETRVLGDITALSSGDEKLRVEHMVYGGSALRCEQVEKGPAVLLISDSLLVAEGALDSADQDQAVLVAIEGGPAQGIELVSKRPRDVETVNLAGAQIVVSVGRGIEKEEDLQLARDLARSLQGEVGCTRPIAEGVRWMSHERYIGVSGAMLKPTLFVAVGLSGQIQHMVGAHRAKTIVAINKDKNAPIFKQADYGIVGDLYEVLPKLTTALM